MKVLFKSREPEAIAMHELAKARSEFVFRRLAWLISKATVSLSDINGPRGGVDKRCQVEVQLNREHKVVATSIARLARRDRSRARSRGAYARAPASESQADAPRPCARPCVESRTGAGAAGSNGSARASLEEDGGRVTQAGVRMRICVRGMAP